MTQLLEVSRLVVVFIKYLEFEQIFPVKFLQEPPQERLPVVLSHLHTDLLPGLVSGAAPEPSLLPHSLVQLEQVQGLLEKNTMLSSELLSSLWRSGNLVHGGGREREAPLPAP